MTDSIIATKGSRPPVSVERVRGGSVWFLPRVTNLVAAAVTEQPSLADTLPPTPCKVDLSTSKARSEGFCYKYHGCDQHNVFLYWFW